MVVSLIVFGFWMPYLFFIMSFILISNVFLKICHLGYFTSYFVRLYFKSSYLAIFWMADFINFFVEDNQMAEIFGIKPGTPYDYVLKDQEKDPEENQIIWKLKPLDVHASAEISDMIYSAKGFGKKREEQLKSGTQQLEILKRGLVGWTNFKYEDGSEVEFEDISQARNNTEKSKIMERNLNKVPPKVRDELADEIRGTSSLDQD